MLHSGTTLKHFSASSLNPYLKFETDTIQETAKLEMRNLRLSSTLPKLPPECIFCVFIHRDTFNCRMDIKIVWQCSFWLTDHFKFFHKTIRQLLRIFHDFEVKSYFLKHPCRVGTTEWGYFNPID